MSTCGCGHEHTSGRLGSCSKFTCPCNHWHPPEEEGDRSVSPRPESARPEGVVEGVVTGSPSSSGGKAWYVVNRWSNHRCLSAWNLWLNNELVMYRYYERTGWPQDRLKGRRGYRQAIVKAALLGWTPWQIGLRRRAVA